MHFWKLIGVDACTVDTVMKCFLVTPSFLPPGRTLLEEFGFLWFVAWAEKIKPLKSCFADIYLLFICLIFNIFWKVDPHWTILMLISNLWKIKDTFQVFTDTSFVLDSMMYVFWVELVVHISTMCFLIVLTCGFCLVGCQPKEPQKVSWRSRKELLLCTVCKVWKRGKECCP